MARFREPLIDDRFDALQTGIMHFRGGELAGANAAARRLLDRSLADGLTEAALLADLGLDAAAGLADEAAWSGGSRHVALRRHGNDDERVWELRDSGEAVRLRAELAAQSGIAAHGSQAVLVVDAAGSIQFANAPCLNWLGCAESDLIGRSLSEWEEARAGTRPVAASERVAAILDAGEQRRYEAWHRHANGNLLPTEVTARPLERYGERLLMLSIDDDSERIEHIQALLAAKSEAELANRAKSSFLALTSHELRTPLTSIVGFCELMQLQFGGQHEELDHYLTCTVRSAERLRGLINDILELTSVEARCGAQVRRELDLEHILDLVCQVRRPEAESKGLGFERAVSGGVPRSYHGDPMRMRQLMDQLIGNAVKFTDSGTVGVRLDYGDEAVELCVTDSGPGIPMHLHERIFEPFYQREDHHTRAIDGTGLGLTICRQIAEALDGSIAVEPRAGGGSAFTVRLPFEAGEDS